MTEKRPYTLSQSLRQLLVQWLGEQSHHPLGSTNLELRERVSAVLKQEPDETAESVYIALTNETRGVRGSDQREAKPSKESPKAKTKRRTKRGRPTADPAKIEKIAKEYYEGFEEGLWSTKTEYLRKCHRARWAKSSGAAKTWFSTLLKKSDKPIRKSVS